ncbi:MAG: radical SAM protein [Phycisphaerae bacterium]|nr:radical SAM protein [Phycisphaerae bacterium]MDD5380960.1 radical SAM protein [Phycisphaerae bacterium]
MKPKILLLNPPIYDFAAYDFWLKPYGLLSAAGYLRGKAEFIIFDYLDRLHPFMTGRKELKFDKWGRGRFYFEKVTRPPCLAQIPRYFRRFGLPRSLFQNFLTKQQPCDFIFVQTMMTYWYNGVQEVIEDVRKTWPKAKIVLGGNYVTLCYNHAQKLGADFLVRDADLQLLWEYLNITPDLKQPALWEAYEKLNVGVLKLSDGCPFNCTYCSVPNIYGKFEARPMEHSLAELQLLVKLGVENIAFYDDALLFDAEKVLIPFLEEVLRHSIEVNFHTPNAINARFITSKLAKLMVQAGFKTFYLGFESSSPEWQQRTGSKVFSDELAQAVKHLTAAGAEPTNITAYQILGHPYTDIQELEASMHFANSLGIRGMLADFSPIPGTPDGEYCRKWVDMNEPLFHNKTAFPNILLGFDETNRLKDLQRQLNRNVD